MSANIYAYWGKAGEGNTCHLLPYHCLDVAACGVTLLRRLHRWRTCLETLSGISGDRLETLVLVYFALHDLGKLATAFQNLRPDLLQRLQGRSSDKVYTTRHDTLGYRLWLEDLAPWLIGQRRLPSSSRREPRPPQPVTLWMSAVTGHHGQPPGGKSQWQGTLEDSFDLQDREAAKSFLQAVLDLAGGDSFPEPSENTAPEASWWLAGLTILADWLGSNRDFFPYRDEACPLADYWKTALQRAERAIEAAGLRTDPPSERFTLADCFRKPPENLRPTPLQRWGETVETAPGPSLFILEDVTGAGKTEAALILTHRLLRTNDGAGLYLGLPTMATANGMYRRLGPVYRRLFAPDASPSLILAHGRAEQVAAFRESVLPPPTAEPDYGDGTEPAGARCSAWLADNRKKTLLAEAGVGTVDQALLTILPSRHQSLRLLGLLGKVLLVDEVHACDAYMNRLLAHLLHAHARAGGSAILLSATLPHQQRRELLRAFAEGAGWREPDVPDQKDYPLATHLSAHGLIQQPLKTRPEVARRVAVAFVEVEEEAETVLATAVAEGRCACWIRNTVDEARHSFEALREHHPDWRIDLFHARFTLTDRLAIEQQVLEAFGKDSGPVQRRGRVLIATQVVEQSLDLDFDVMISDLAPIDLLIQRAGRLHRHARDTQGKRIDGPDRRGTPTLSVLAPTWDADPGPRWLRDVLPGTAAVYEAEDGRLWRAMKLLREAGGWSMPEDARRLVEGVYGADPFTDFPKGLQDKTLEAEGLIRAKASIAEDKVLDLDSGYRLDGPWLDEDNAPTRLGEPTTTVWLARLKDGRLLPLHGGRPDDAEAWMLSALTLRRSLVQREVIPDGISETVWQTLKETLPARGRWGVVIVMQPDGTGWQGAAVDGNNHVRTVNYSHSSGLEFIQGA